MRKYRNYTDEDIIRFAKEVKSIAGLLRKLNLKVVGGNYANIKRNLQRLDIDTSHWTGQGWNKDAQTKDWQDYTKGAYLKPHLIKLKGHKCERCNNTEWLNEIIPLELHHKDGVKSNNNLDNLQLLCPNCHAFTDNYRKPKFT
jgi:5-methylcytosine-specific restriction endonuclease McrA